MFLIDAIIQDEVGLHARPASQFVRTAGRFKSDILVQRVGDEQTFNAKSIVSVLKLAAVKGTHIRISATGQDEMDACVTLKALLESGSHGS